MPIMNRLRDFAEHPAVNAVVAFSIVVASLFELEDIIVTDLDNIEGEHGMLLFGLLHLFKSLPDMMDTVENGRDGVSRLTAVVRGERTGASREVSSHGSD